MLFQIGSCYNAGHFEKNCQKLQICIEFLLSFLIGFYHYQKFIDRILDIFFIFQPVWTAFQVWLTNMSEIFLCVIEMVNGKLMRERSGSFENHVSSNTVVCFWGIPNWILFNAMSGTRILYDN